MQTLQGSPNKFLGALNDVEQKNAPNMLYVCGAPAIMRKRPRVSIIGSRKASPSALRDANDIACMVVEYGGVAVSGLAAGVDAAAHLGALRCEGDTIAVIGTPLSKSYPAANKGLQQEICKKGVVVTQFAEGMPTQPKNFVMRNRTMALLSHASVIVEASEKSGTQHQGWEALRLGRLLFMPEHLFTAEFDWPRKMLEYGAIGYQDLGQLRDIMMDLLPPANYGSSGLREAAGVAF